MRDPPMLGKTDPSVCSEPKCQTERKRRWHRRKLAEDSDYRENLHTGTDMIDMIVAIRSNFGYNSYHYGYKLVQRQ